MKRVGLTAITIENFKSIGAPVTIPLRPITLLFGANSVGKSTVIQAMQYTRMERTFNSRARTVVYLLW